MRGERSPTRGGGGGGRVEKTFNVNRPEYRGWVKYLLFGSRHDSIQDAESQYMEIFGWVRSGIVQILKSLLDSDKYETVISKSRLLFRIF